MSGESMLSWVQLLLQGVSTGAIYGLVALGIVLGHKATGVVNFAHGDLVMLGAFIAWWLIAQAGLSFWQAGGVAMGAVALFNLGCHTWLVRRVASGPRHAAVLLTIGLGFVIRGAVTLVFGPESRSYPTPWTGATTRWGGLVVADLNLAILAAACAVSVALALLLRGTAVGLAMQAAALNPLAARLMGVDVARLNGWAWAGCGALAALCGLLLAPITLVDPSLWHVVLKALAAVVLGGLGSAQGALVGGLVIGLVEQFCGVYLPDGSKDVAPYVLLVAALLLRPAGLFAERAARRV